MKFTILILTLSIFVSCTNEPLKPYNLNKTELENAQKAYENSTIQHQEVQSKSIITITKNETKVLAMIEIFQNWELDSLEEQFEPIEEKAKAILTYYQDEFQIKPHIFDFRPSHQQNYYNQYMDLVLNLGLSQSDVFNGKANVPVIIDFNGYELKKGNGMGFSIRTAMTFESKKNNKNDIVKLSISYSVNDKKKVDEDIYKFTSQTFIISDLDESINLNRTQQKL